VRVQFKSLFKNKKMIVGKKWVCNNYFLVDRKVLTKQQNKWLDKQNLPDEDEKLKKIIKEICKYNISEKLVAQQIKFFVNNKKKDSIIAYMSTKKGIDFYVDGMYYHFFTNRKVDIYITDNYSPISALYLIKNNKFVGLLMPLKIKSNKEFVDYDKWKKEREEEKRLKKESQIV